MVPEITDYSIYCSAFCLTCLHASTALNSLNCMSASLIQAPCNFHPAGPEMNHHYYITAAVLSVTFFPPFLQGSKAGIKGTSLLYFTLTQNSLWSRVSNPGPKPVSFMADGEFVPTSSQLLFETLLSQQLSVERNWETPSLFELL